MAQQFVYAFEWNDCVYESDFAVVSVHATKRGAYMAMREHLLTRWEQEVSYYCYDKPLVYSDWRVKTHQVKE